MQVRENVLQPSFPSRCYLTLLKQLLKHIGFAIFKNEGFYEYTNSWVLIQKIRCLLSPSEWPLSPGCTRWQWPFGKSTIFWGGAIHTICNLIQSETMNTESMFTVL